MIPSLSPPGRSSPSERSAAAPRRPRFSKKRVRRAVLSFWAVVIVLALGTLGFYLLAGLDWVNAFYFECMLATGQGPPFLLTNDPAKLFASAMAFVSVGTVLTTLVVNFGPIIGQLWREGIEHAERELKKVEAEVVDELTDR